MSGEMRVDRERVAAVLYAHGLRSGDHATYDAAYCAQVADAVLALLPAPHPQGAEIREDDPVLARTPRLERFAADTPADEYGTLMHPPAPHPQGGMLRASEESTFNKGETNEASPAQDHVGPDTHGHGDAGETAPVAQDGPRSDTVRLAHPDLVTLRALSDAATHGPWHHTSDPLGEHVENGDGQGRIVFGREDRPEHSDRANAALIAAAVNYLRALLAAAPAPTEGDPYCICGGGADHDDDCPRNEDSP